MQIDDQKHGDTEEFSIFSFFDAVINFYVFLKSHWKFIIGSTLFFGVLGAAGAFLMPNKYLATAEIVSGQALGNVLETNDVLLDKMTIPTYYSQKTLDACLPTTTKDEGEVSPRAEALIKALKPRVEPKHIYISIENYNKSPNLAGLCLDSVLSDIVENQAERMRSIVEAAYNKIKYDEEKIAESERLLKDMTKFLNGNSNGNGNGNGNGNDIAETRFNSASLLMSLVSNNKYLIQDLIKDINDTKISLADPATQKAHFAVPIYVKEYQRSSIKPLTFTAVGLAFGLILGFVAVYIWEKWQKYTLMKL